MVSLKKRKMGCQISGEVSLISAGLRESLSQAKEEVVIFFYDEQGSK